MGMFSREVAGLEEAIEADDPIAIERIIASGVDVNARGAHNITPLMWAVDRIKPKVVAKLLALGADPNLKADDGNGVVNLAVENYRRAPQIMEMIFQGGGDPNTRRPNDDPVITRFLNDRNCEYLGKMKSLGADLEITTRAGDPLITNASVARDWDIVWCLIELGAGFNHENTRRPISRSLAGRFPAPDSPIYPYKLKVWEHLKANGIAVPPLYWAEHDEP